MTIAVIGGGLVGRRVAAELARTTEVVLVGASRVPAPIDGVRCVVGTAPSLGEIEAAVVATSAAEQFDRCATLLASGVPVVSTAGNADIVERLWTLGAQAVDRDVPFVVGAAFSPGLSGLIAAWLIASFDVVFEVQLARFGTGGPACAREHHRAAKIGGCEVREGRLARTRAGSGRTLVWFPGEAGGADCYHGGHSDPFLLHQAFPEIPRIQARMAATRRDRLTARIPMLRPPHPEGLVGALTVEVRGRIGTRIEHRVVGATASQATGAAAIAALMARRAVAGELEVGPQSTGDLADPGRGLSETSADLGLSTYDGSQLSYEADSPIQAARAWRLGRK